MTRWIFLGDDSRWKFICWILKMSIKDLPGQGRTTLLIRHGSVEYQLLEEEVGLAIVTYNLLPGMEVFVPAYSEDLQLSLEKFDRCALFEKPMMLFVLMDLLDEIDYDPLVDAKTRKASLIRKGRDVLIARGTSDVFDILHWHRPLVADLRRRIQHELKQIRNQVNRCVEYYAEYVKNWRINDTF